MRQRCRSLLLAALLCACGAGANVARVATSGPLVPCSVPGVSRPARCGALEVPENPDRPDGRRIALNVIAIPAASASARPDPIVPLLGGPGEDAGSAAAYFVEQLGPLLDERDLLLVDQRGTGGSGALRCALYSPDDPAASLRDLFPPAAVERCAVQLAAGADLTQYTYPRFASDLEHVRRALGYGPLNLFAGSYGTRAAQVYLRAYPASVRTAYLGSPVPIDFAMPLPMARAAQQALDATLDACAADAACGAAFPRLRDELREVVARLDAGEARVTIPGVDAPVELQRGRVMEWFRAQLYRPSSAAELPWLLHRAHADDWGPIAERILRDVQAADSALSFGLLFAITCSEDLPFVREQDVVPETQGTLLGDWRVRQQQAACRYWPRAALPEGHRRAVRSSVPALFVSGDSDGGTPLAFTEHIAQGFAQRAEVVLRGRGHTEWTPCVERLYARFIASGSAREIAGATCPAEPRPPFRTR